MPSLGTFPARIQIFGSTLVSMTTLMDYARAAQFRVDNMDPAIRYEGPWEVGPRCNVHCLGTPDPTKIYGGTWHAAKWESTPRSLEYTFNGTEIAIYGIVAEARDLAVFNVTHSWNTSLTLNVDGMQVDSYQFHSDVEDLSVTYIYDTLFLTGSNLSNTPHTARIDLVPPSQFLVRFSIS
ncbi:hypothetical protein CPB86DRAFT_362356 [Serendipita vermifera]|nr:hypothetical protein CPB86DRAFT_362356 [Serendipita vermifera]